MAPETQSARPAPVISHWSSERAHRRVSLSRVTHRWPMIEGLDLFGGPIQLRAER